jgi:hypothetical protein
MSKPKDLHIIFLITTFLLSLIGLMVSINLLLHTSSKLDEEAAQEPISIADEDLCASLQISSAPESIIFDIEEPPPRTSQKVIFTSYSIPLQEGVGWNVGSPEGPQATMQEILSVLCNIGALTFRFEGDVQIFLIM